jgi:hypothetical protein
VSVIQCLDVAGDVIHDLPVCLAIEVAAGLLGRPVVVAVVGPPVQLLDLHAHLVLAGCRSGEL